MTDKKSKKRGLPEQESEWTMEHDLIVLRRIQRIIRAIPASAQVRIKSYALELLKEVVKS